LSLSIVFRTCDLGNQIDLDIQSQQTAEKLIAVVITAHKFQQDRQQMTQQTAFQRRSTNKGATIAAM